ncbi:MAG: transposase [Candidatus Sedimenticola sp. (ex Thyasira tokunagai)]
MPKPRKALISLDSTPYYHCISRCVRRAFLCGEDSLTGKNYEHRKQWVVDRLTELSTLFAIDIAAYSVLSNHYHIILRVDRQTVDNWSETELMERWKQLFSLPVLVSRYALGEATTQAEIDTVHQIFSEWRERLCDISWFMRCLNEHLARRGNKEDNCTGRFWEGRFKSQALLDEAALLTCMGYVDLNPIRANMASTPEESDYTSIQQRIREALNQSTASERQPALMPLVKQKDDNHPNAIGFTTLDYLELVDWAGRAVREGKRGAIPSGTPPLLQRMGLEADAFVNYLRGHRGRPHPVALGPVEKIRETAKQLGQRFIKGMGESRMLYST